MNQHFISQFLIKKWLGSGENYLNVFDIKQDTFTDKFSKNPLTAKGVFCSRQITGHNKIFNEISEKKINDSKIEDVADEIIKNIEIGNLPNKHEMNSLMRYFQLFRLLSSCYYWKETKINEDKLNKYVDFIINKEYCNNFLIMRKKRCDEDIILTMNAFLCRYGDVEIFTISPDILLAFGQELSNTVVELSKSKLNIFNSDLAKVDFLQEDNIKLFPYIVFRNNSHESIKKLLERPQQGLKIILRIDEEQTNQVKQQGINWNEGEYLLSLGERDEKNYKKNKVMKLLSFQDYH